MSKKDNTDFYKKNKLNNLYKLYLRNTSKTPLEDFTTEALAGLLRFNENIANKFISELLQIPESTYQIKTQVKYDLENDVNCIIDLVFEAENSICFIENKVNSHEGERQLERYSKILDMYNHDGYQTYLFYCTKNYDKKEHVAHNFKQFRWFQIANFLKSYNTNSLIADFINFLKLNKMSQELTIYTKDLLTLESLFDLINLLKGHLEKIRPIFIETFISNNNVSDGFSTSQILNHKRVIMYHKDILANGYSEIKYGFQTSNSNIYVGIWVDKSNSEYELLKKHFSLNHTKFEVHLHDKGITVELKSKLSNYLNKENGDSEITEWFKESFEEFAKLIRETSTLNWKIRVKQTLPESVSIVQ